MLLMRDRPTIIQMQDVTLGYLARATTKMVDYRSRQLAIAKQILEHQVFNQTLKIHLTCGEMPDRQAVMQIMKNSNLYNLEADSTYYRRASTVIGWVNWILDTIDDL